ncbi:TPA: hypothetical protein DF272_05670 [Candidatus Falkowbacteria bacterium]|nr:hypothetical protein [Candidatus Falkowbacteria bacterium]
MKILLINKFYYQRGGAETVFFRTKQLLEAAGHKVVVFSMQDPRNEESPFSSYFVSPINFDEFDSVWAKIKKIPRSFYSIEAKNKLLLLIKQEKPDVAHIHNFEHHLTPSILAALKRAGVPVVQTLHDFQLISPSYNLRLGDYSESHGVKLWRIMSKKRLRDSFLVSMWAVKEFYLKKWLRLYEAKVDVFICPSEFLKIQCEKRGVRKKIFTLFNPVTLDIKDDESLVGGRLVCVSRLIDGKGVDMLIDVVGQMGTIPLDVIGSGPMFAALKQKIKDQNYLNVNLLGELAMADIVKHLQTAKLVVVPTLFYENQPMVILEAMAAGKAVLAADIGGIPELIEPGKTGWLFDPGQADDLRQKLSELWPQAEVLDEVGGRAQIYVKQKFSETNYVRQLVQIYLQLMNRKIKLG